MFVTAWANVERCGIFALRGELELSWRHTPSNALQDAFEAVQERRRRVARLRTADASRSAARLGFLGLRRLVMSAVSFLTFCRQTLDLQLTRGQTALCRVAFDGELPADIVDSKERAAALSMSGPSINPRRRASRESAPVRPRLGQGTIACARVPTRW